MLLFSQLEEPLLEKAKQKMNQLVKSDSSKVNAAKFIEESISVLIKSRHILQFCYVYGYYLQETGVKRMVFEFLQVNSTHLYLLTGSCYIFIYSIPAHYRYYDDAVV